MYQNWYKFYIFTVKISICSRNFFYILSHPNGSNNNITVTSDQCFDNKIIRKNWKYAFYYTWHANDGTMTRPGIIFLLNNNNSNNNNDGKNNNKMIYRSKLFHHIIFIIFLSFQRYITWIMYLLKQQNVYLIPLP